MQLNRWLVWLASAFIFGLWACAQGATPKAGEKTASAGSGAVGSESSGGGFAERLEANPNLQRATFAGGCFWCVQPPFDELPGVVATRVGYTGGAEINPTYQQVARGQTGHTEAIEVLFDPTRVSYEKLLDVLWRSIDPTDSTGQFVDRGRQYRPEIFYHSEAQRELATASKLALGKNGPFEKPITIEITQASTFYPAEDYHQSYYKKEPRRYYRYRRGSGRDQFISRVWKGDR
jgi:methionine-S-sulfoxide reductase